MNQRPLHHVWIHRESLSSNAVYEAIQSAETTLIKKWGLSAKEYLGIPQQVLALQASGKKMLAKKAPSWFHRKGVLYPLASNIEQSSSEETAKAKSQILERYGAKEVVDVSAGFGIDSFEFSKNFKTHHNDLDADLLKLTQHNAQLLGLNLSFSSQPAELWLAENSLTNKWIYSDPMRRDNTGSRFFDLQDCTPNALHIVEQHLSYCQGILFKLSPMVDQNYILQTWGDKVQEIEVVTKSNEVKELLVVLKNTPCDSPVFRVVEVKNEPHLNFEFQVEDLESELPFQPIEKGQWLIDVSSGLRKLKAIKAYGNSVRASLTPCGGFLALNQKPENVLGKVFHIQEVHSFKSSEMKTYKKGNYSVVCRNFSQKAPAIESKYQLKPHNTQFLLFGGQNKAISWVAKAERVG